MSAVRNLCQTSAQMLDLIAKQPVDIADKGIYTIMYACHECYAK